MSKEILLLVIRNLIADKEFNTATANREMQTLGAWQTNHEETHAYIENEIQLRISQYQNCL